MFHFNIDTSRLLDAHTAPTTWTLLVFLTFLFLIFYFVIHPLFLSSLSHIPGPGLAAFSWYYISYFDIQLKRNRTILAWHRQYGPVVRIRPAEVALASPVDFRDVYQGKSRYDKGQYFQLFTHHGKDCLFSTTSYAEHQASRRQLAGAYTKTAVLKNAEGFVRERVKRVLERMGSEEEEGKLVDFFLLWACFSMDVITRYVYGLPHGTRSIEDNSTRGLIRPKQRAQLWAPVWTNLPWFHGSWIARQVLPAAYAKALVTASKLQKFAERMMKKQDGDSRRDEYTSVYRVLRDSQAKSGSLDGDAAASELFDQLTAGQDTTTSHLTSLTWRLARHRGWQTMLRDELSALELTKDGFPTYADLERCAVLDAVVRETLRFHPVSSGRTERIVPKGGRTYSGVFVPEGTTVVGQLLAIHRNEDVFPDPDTWKPERWLEASKEEFIEMEKSYVPFGYGGRICIGRHLAMLEIKTAVSMLVKHFELSLHPSCTDASMETLDTLAAVPKGLRCELVVNAASGAPPRQVEDLQLCMALTGSA